MKKITLFFTAALLSLSLVACNSDAGASAYKVYKDVVAKMDSVKSMEAKIDGVIKATIEGNEVPIEMNGTVKQVITDDNNIQMQMDIATMGVSTSGFYTDGYFYMDAAGTKFKMAMPMEEMKATSNTQYLNFEESAVKESKVEDVNGDKKVSFTLDGKSIGDIADKMLQSLKKSLGASVSATFSDMEYVCTISKDSVLKDYNVKFVATISAEGQEMTFDYDLNVTYTGIDNVTIDIPENLDEYQETAA